MLSQKIPKNLNPFVFFALPHVIISLGHYCIFAVLLAVAFSLPIRTAFEAGERGAEEVEHLLSSSIHYWNVYARSWFTREGKIKSGKFCIENWFSEFCLPQSQIAPGIIPPLLVLNFDILDVLVL